MNSELKNKIEVVTNIVIIIAIVLVAGIAVKRHFFPDVVNSVKGNQGQQIVSGARINIPNVDWAQNKKTLVFALKNGCPYCTTSAPFYKELIAEAQKRDVKLIALVPDSLEVGRNYIQSLDLPIENIQSVSLQSYAIVGTPTVLFLDDTGTVRSVWTGGVMPDRALEMKRDLISLFDDQVSPASVSEVPNKEKTSNASPIQVSDEVEVTELKNILDKKNDLFLIDIDERDDYKKEHIPGAKNIPADEMEVRAHNEIPKDKRVIIYCRCPSDTVSRDVKYRLEKRGFGNISVLKGGLESWKNSRAAMSATT